MNTETRTYTNRPQLPHIFSVPETKPLILDCKKEIERVFCDLHFWENKDPFSKSLFSWKERSLVVCEQDNCIKGLQKILVSPIFLFPLQDAVLVTSILLVDSKKIPLSAGPITTPLVMERHLAELYKRYSPDIQYETHDLIAALLDLRDRFSLKQEPITPPSKKEKALVQEMEFVSRSLDPSCEEPDPAIIQEALEIINQWILDADSLERNKKAEEEQKKQEIKEAAERTAVFELEKVQARIREQEQTKRLKKLQQQHEERNKELDVFIKKVAEDLKEIKASRESAEQELQIIQAKKNGLDDAFKGIEQEAEQAAHEYYQAMKNRLNRPTFGKF